MSIYAIIPARSGSKGVHKKNLRNLGGYPLIAYSIAIAKQCSLIKKVIISTDCEEIAEVGRHFGAEVPFLRPKNISTDTSTDLEFMLHIIEWFKTQKISLPNYWIHLRATTPIRDVNIVNDAIKKIIENDCASSLRSAHEAAESPFKWFVKNPTENYFDPLFGIYNENYLTLPRQLVPKVYVPDGYVDILKTETILKDGSMHGNKIFAFESPFCIEIDTLNDFEYLDFQIKNNKFEICEYLKNYKK